MCKTKIIARGLKIAKKGLQVFSKGKRGSFHFCLFELKLACLVEAKDRG